MPVTSIAESEHPSLKDLRPAIAHIAPSRTKPDSASSSFARCRSGENRSAHEDRFSRQRQTNRFQEHKRQHDPSAVLVDQLLHGRTAIRGMTAAIPTDNRPPSPLGEPRSSPEGKMTICKEITDSTCEHAQR